MAHDSEGEVGARRQPYDRSGLNEDGIASVSSARPASLTSAQMANFAMIFFGIGALFALAWHIRSVLLLLFGSIIVAVVLLTLAAPYRKWLKLPDWAALLASILTVAAIIGVSAWLVGSEVAAQVAVLAEELPSAWNDLEERFAGTLVGEAMESLSNQVNGAGMVSSLGQMSLSVGSAIVDILIVVVAGIFIAATPGNYRSGILKLFPKQRRALASDAIENSGTALSLWLRGQVVQMLLIGTLTGVGLALIGVPSALTLGIFAGLLEFVPFLGPIIAAVPALILAATQGTDTFLWTAGLYLFIQQVEGNIIQPLVQRHAVNIPPAVLLFAILVAAPIFGFPGILLAAPLAVFIFVLIKQFYVREVLDTTTIMPGDDESEKVE